MEQDQVQAEMPSYWPSVAIGGFIVAIVTSIASTGYLYYLASAEPSMAVMIQAGMVSLISCLLGMIGGIISNRHYAKSNEITYTIGKGALIGFLTGVAAVLIGTILGQIWQVIDPALMDNFASNLISSLETADMPEAQLEEAIASTQKSMAEQKTLVGILKGMGIGILAMGAINAITGMIGAKLFASPEED